MFGSCSVGRARPTLLQRSFQPRAPLKHIIINQAAWLLCIPSLLLNYVISNKNIHIPFFLHKRLRAEHISALCHTGLWFISLPKTNMQGKSPRARALNNQSVGCTTWYSLLWNHILCGIAPLGSDRDQTVGHFHQPLPACCTRSLVHSSTPAFHEHNQDVIAVIIEI